MHRLVLLFMHSCIHECMQVWNRLHNNVSEFRLYLHSVRGASASAV